MRIDFSDKHVVVVGAARGIGWTTVEAFANAGAQVSALDIKPDVLCDATSAYRGAGTITLNSVDVTNVGTISSSIARATNDHGGLIHSLIYIAGGLLGLDAEPIENTETANWDRIVEVNARGAFLVCREAVPALKRAKGASVVVVTSAAGLRSSRTGVLAYTAAKHAQVGLVKQLATELAPSSITVNAVAPGFVPAGEDSLRHWDRMNKTARAAYAAGLVGGRVGTADDISNAILFLASDKASWITGQTIAITGASIG